MGRPACDALDRSWTILACSSDGAAVLEELPALRWPVMLSAEHEAIDGHLPSLRRASERLTAAVDGRVVTPVRAGVVWRTRVQQDDDTLVAVEVDVNVRTMQRRRQRAGRQLAAASLGQLGVR